MICSPTNLCPLATLSQQALSTTQGLGLRKERREEKRGGEKRREERRMSEAAAAARVGSAVATATASIEQ